MQQSPADRTDANRPASRLSRWADGLLDLRAPLWKQAVVAAVALVVFAGVGMLCARHTGFTTPSTGVVKIYLQYPLLSVAALAMNPVFAFAAGFFGHLLLDVLSGDGTDYVALCIGSGTFGLMMSLLSRRWIIRRNAQGAVAGRRFLASILLASLFAWPVVSAVSIALIQGTDPGEAFASCLRIGVVNFTVVVVMDAILALFLHRHFITAVIGVLLTASLFVVSYGNFAIGCIVLYVLTLVCSTQAVVVAFLLPDGRDAGRRRKAVANVAGLIALSVGLLAVFFGATQICCAPTGDERAVIVLGCGLDGTRPGSILASRLDAAAEFAEGHPNAVIVVSGGQGAGEAVSEAKAMHDYLVERGIDDGRILMEDGSFTTAENLRNSLGVLRSAGFDERTPVVIATSGPHCFRAYLLAQRAGFTNPSVIGSSIPWTLVVPEYVREILAIGKFAVLDG